MKKFAFSLQKVLEYRKSIEDRLLGELAAIRADCDRADQKLRELITLKKNHLQNLKQCLSEGDVERIKHANSFIQQLTYDISRQLTVILELETKKDRKTAEVVNAARERKAMERLRELKFDDYRCLMQHEDQKFLDDIATIKHSRSSQRV